MGIDIFRQKFVRISSILTGTIEHCHQHINLWNSVWIFQKNKFDFQYSNLRYINCCCPIQIINLFFAAMVVIPESFFFSAYSGAYFSLPRFKPWLFFLCAINVS